MNSIVFGTLSKGEQKQMNIKNGMSEIASFEKDLRRLKVTVQKLSNEDVGWKLKPYANKFDSSMLTFSIPSTIAIECIDNALEYGRSQKTFLNERWSERHMQFVIHKMLEKVASAFDTNDSSDDDNSE